MNDPVPKDYALYLRLVYNLIYCRHRRKRPHVRETVRVHGQDVSAQSVKNNGRGQRPGNGTVVEPRRRFCRAKARAEH